VLDTGKVNYSFGSLHEVMAGSIKEMVAWGVPAERVLMLGYGGGSAAEIIHQDINRDAEIIGVEWDEAVIELAKKYFYTHGVRLLNEDAVEYVFKAAKQSWEYDLIICDLFTESKVASAVLEGNFLVSVAKLLGSGGGVVINTMLNKSAAIAFLSVLNTHFDCVKTWDGMKGNAVFLCKMGGIA
jgi:spermidine synthase